MSEANMFSEDYGINKQKVKVLQADIIVQKTDSGPYYLIKYKEIGKDDYTLGYGSYNFDFVFDWLSTEFEVVKEEKQEQVIQFPVNMDEMQHNILIELLNARKECTDENMLTAHGMVAVIDALFYLVKETPVRVPNYCPEIKAGRQTDEKNK